MKIRKFIQPHTVGFLLFTLLVPISVFSQAANQITVVNPASGLQGASAFIALEFNCRNGEMTDL